MQITGQVYYDQRVLYYWSKFYYSQLQPGNAFNDLKTIRLGILSFDCFEKESNYHNIFKILNVRSYESYFEDLKLHFIELNKFNTELSHIKTALYRWANFLKIANYYSCEILPKELLVGASIRKAFKSLEHLSTHAEEVGFYEARLK
jgi:predicted transposase/invertase (TIGR01784 family)